MEVCCIKVDQISSFVVGFRTAAAVRLCGLADLCDNMAVFSKLNGFINVLKEVGNSRDSA